jgi:hypothetical protein
MGLRKGRIPRSWLSNGHKKIPIIIGDHQHQGIKIQVETGRHQSMTMISWLSSAAWFGTARWGRSTSRRCP